MRSRKSLAGFAAACAGMFALACADQPTSVEQPAFNKSQAGGPKPVLSDKSVTPPLVKNLARGVEVYSLISSDDVLPGSPGFIFGGSADGMGFLRSPFGGWTLVVNNEDNFSVARIQLDNQMTPLSGDYLLDSDAGQWRLCSATLATPEEHGFGPVFITAGESGIESMIHAVDPFGPPNSSTLLSAFGHWSTENAVPLPKNAYNRKTVVIIGDDDSGTYGGQVAMYVGPQGDLSSGDLFVMARTDDNATETDMVPGASYDVEFRQIPNQQSLTGGQINQYSAVDLKAIRFGRVEDIDYRKGAKDGREIYFIVTGQGASGANADRSRTVYGRVYRLTLDPRTPTRGTLEVVLDGDDRGGPAGTFQNPDNILVTRNYAYVQEDPNGYGDETHDAYIYQYNLNTGAVNIVMELDHQRGNPYYGGGGDFGAWEYGAFLDVSDKLGGSGADGTFLLAIQPHTWRGAKYQSPDGGARRPNENQASQIILVTGLPR